MSVTITNPQTGLTVRVGRKLAVRWTGSGSTYNIKISTDNGSNYTTIASGVSAPTYRHTITESASATCKIKVEDAADAANNAVSSTFTIGTPAVTTIVGVNVAAPYYATAAWVFADLMRHSSNDGSSSGWYSAPLNYSGFSDGRAITVSSDGWPTSLLSDQSASLLLPPRTTGHWPVGNYNFSYSGTGTFSFGFNASQVSHNSGAKTGVVSITGTGTSGVYFHIDSTDSGDPLHDFKIFHPGHTVANTFNSTYMSMLSPYNVLRFMDWGAINNSTETDWTDRRTSTFRCQTHAAYEHMIALCNQTGNDMWVCIPHLATDDYVTSLATLIFSTLNSPLKVYVEYSNETWNFIFTQATYVQTQGSGLAHPTFGYAGKRSAEIFALFSTAFGGLTRIVRVVAGQAANTAVINEKLAELATAGGGYDAIAIAPYFGDAVANAIHVADPTIATTVVADVLESCRQSLYGTVNGRITSHLTIASGAGKRLICYEAGQHLLGTGAANNNTSLTTLLTSANRDADMGTLYTEYLTFWEGMAGDLFNQFNETCTMSKAGFWGALETQDADFEGTGAPKYKALRDFSLYTESSPPPASRVTSMWSRGRR